MSRRTRNDLRSMGVRLPYAGACGKGTTRLDSSDSSGFRMLRPMERAADDHVAAKLKVTLSVPTTVLHNLSSRGRTPIDMPSALRPLGLPAQRKMFILHSSFRHFALSSNRFLGRDPAVAM